MNMSLKEFELAAAMSLCLEWPPTATYDFLALVRNDRSKQYPPADQAFVIACRNCGMRGDVKRKWKHGVIYETANRIGWGRLSSASEGYFKTFRTVYEQVCNEHAEGKTFVIPKSHRLENSHTVISPDSPMNAELEDFFAQFGSKGKKNVA